MFMDRKSQFVKMSVLRNLIIESIQSQPNLKLFCGYRQTKSKIYTEAKDPE